MSDDILIGRGWGFPVGVDATGGIRMAGGHVEMEQGPSRYRYLPTIEAGGGVEGTP